MGHETTTQQTVQQGKKKINRIHAHTYREGIPLAISLLNFLACLGL
jgi:hypothetical protein